MELRQLRYFVKVAETLNFSEAAKALCVTQSTLSQQIRQLEDELGEPLLSRTSHSVALTEAGHTILDNARAALHEASLCAERIADLGRLATGTLNIGVTYSFSPILTESIIAFMKMYPKIKLNIYYKPMAELMELLRERTVDFALAFKPTVATEGIESHILFQNHLSAVVGSHHPLASRERISLQELERYDLALPSKGLQARNAFDAVVPAGMNLRVRIELNEVNILLKLLRQSMLVSVLAEATIHNERDVRAIPLDTDGAEMTGCVHILRGAYRKKSMLEFVRLLGESVAVRERRDAWL
ncbi:MAG: LysR substrate-binding domain-containing protein [Bacteroides sp.]|nr:LysR substrate-binding domain-containing protein [Bacteroides sp.]MCM1095954.1 LysR substrate-binding domain-containing protein [Terasakiella sp.]